MTIKKLKIRAIGVVSLLIAVVMMGVLVKAEAFNLKVTNNYQKAKSFCLHYFDDKAKNWVTRGWFNVAPGETKSYTFSESKSLKYAYVYSSVMNGEGETDALQCTIIDGKFKYFKGEQCPQGALRRAVPFSKFGMCINGAHLIWGEAAQNCPVQKSAPQQSAQPSQTNIAQDEAKAVALLNADRKKQGLPPLIADARLSQVARRHAADMVAKNFFDHTNLQGQSPFDRLAADGIEFQAAAENIAQNHDVVNMQAGWMKSPGHRANILNAQYTHVGIGLCPGKNGTLYGVQVFTGN